MRTTTTVATATGALLLLALSACGGSAGSTAPSTATSAATSSAATSAAENGPTGFAAYRDCMATNGVTLPDMGRGAPPSGMPTAMPSGAPPTTAPGGGFPGSFPGGLPEGVDQATFDAAQTACASLAPQRGPGNGADPGNIDATALAAFASCLSDHDVTLAGGADELRQLDRTDPTVKTAMDVCAPLLPVPAPSS
jgi:hypothetical protein